MVSGCRWLPERNPSPNPTSSSNEPTPQAMPNMVRKERSLCAHRVRSVCTKISSTIRMATEEYAIRGKLVPGFRLREGEIVSELHGFKNTYGFTRRVTGHDFSRADKPK